MERKDVVATNNHSTIEYKTFYKLFTLCYGVVIVVFLLPHLTRIQTKVKKEIQTHSHSEFSNKYFTFIIL